MCFTLQWFEQLLVWIVIVVTVVALLRLLVPWLASFIGIPIIAQALQIILTAVIAIVVIYFIFALISCIGGAGLPLLPHRL